MNRHSCSVTGVTESRLPRRSITMSASPSVRVFAQGFERDRRVDPALELDVDAVPARRVRIAIGIVVGVLAIERARFRIARAHDLQRRRRCPARRSSSDRESPDRPSSSRRAACCAPGNCELRPRWWCAFFARARSSTPKVEGSVLKSQCFIRSSCDASRRRAVAASLVLVTTQSSPTSQARPRCGSSLLAGDRRCRPCADVARRAAIATAAQHPVVEACAHAEPMAARSKPTSGASTTSRCSERARRRCESRCRFGNPYAFRSMQRRRARAARSHRAAPPAQDARCVQTYAAAPRRADERQRGRFAAHARDRRRCAAADARIPAGATIARNAPLGGAPLTLRHRAPLLAQAPSPFAVPGALRPCAPGGKKRRGATRLCRHGPLLST